MHDRFVHHAPVRCGQMPIASTKLPLFIYFQPQLRTVHNAFVRFDKQTQSTMPGVDLKNLPYKGFGNSLIKIGRDEGVAGLMRGYVL